MKGEFWILSWFVGIGIYLLMFVFWFWGSELERIICNEVGFMEII